MIHVTVKRYISKTSHRTINDDNFQMNETNNLSTSPSEDPLGNYAIRLSEWETNYLSAEVTLLRARLSNTEATALELREMKYEMEAALDEQEKMLEMQAKVERDTIKHLEICLESAARSTQDSVEDETSSRKSPIRIKLESLLADEALIPHFEHTLTSPRAQEDDSKDPIPPENMIWIKSEPLEGTLGTLESDFRRSELEDRIQTQNSLLSLEEVLWEQDKPLLVARTNKFAEQLQSAKTMISILREAVMGKSLLEEAVATMQKKLQAAERVQQWQRRPSGLNEKESRGNSRKRTSCWVIRTLSCFSSLFTKI